MFILCTLICLALVLSGCDIPPRDGGAAANSGEGRDSGNSAVSATSEASGKNQTVNAKGLVTAEVNTGDPKILAQATPHLPVTVKSRKGNEVTVSKADRILALDRSGALAASVWALGLGDRLVGRDISTDFPSASHLPLVTPGGHSVNAEAVLNLSPDLILTDGSIGPQSVFKQLAAAGIAVVYTGKDGADRTLSTAENLMTDIGSALGDQQAGRTAAAAIRKGIDDATATAQKASDGRRMIILYLRGTNVAMIAGPKSGAGELITAVGGTDASSGLNLSSSFTNLTAEALVKAAPDTIIVMKDGLASIGGLSGLHQLPGFDQTPAGRNESVLQVPDTHLLSFGPDCGAVITAMAQALYAAGKEGDIAQ